MSNSKSTGRKPGHNVKKGIKGFLPSPKVIPTPPTPSANGLPFPRTKPSFYNIFDVGRYDDFGLLILTDGEHLAKYGHKKCTPGFQLFTRTKRLGYIYSCPCGKQNIVTDDMPGSHFKEYVRREIPAFRDKDYSRVSFEEDHIKKYGTVCAPGKTKRSKVGETYDCPCGQQWIIRDMSNVKDYNKGESEWMRTEYYIKRTLPGSE